MRKTRGFTIVELLIVIVVIGILAAITLVTYSGLQQRARNAAVESAARAYYNAIQVYATQNGAVPQDGSACLGERADYVNNCFNGPPLSAFNETFIANLRTVIPTLPKVDNRCYAGWDPSNPSNCRYNMTFYRNTGWRVDGEPHPYYLIYFLNGNQRCGLVSLEGSYGNFSTSTSRGYMEQRGGDTMCIIRVPTAT